MWWAVNILQNNKTVCCKREYKFTIKNFANKITKQKYDIKTDYKNWMHSVCVGGTEITDISFNPTDKP